MKIIKLFLIVHCLCIASFALAGNINIHFYNDEGCIKETKNIELIELDDQPILISDILNLIKIYEPINFLDYAIYAEEKRITGLDLGKKVMGMMVNGKPLEFYVYCLKEFNIKWDATGIEFDEEVNEIERNKILNSLIGKFPKEIELPAKFYNDIELQKEIEFEFPKFEGFSLKNNNFDPRNKENEISLSLDPNEIYIYKEDWSSGFQCKGKIYLSFEELKTWQRENKIHVGEWIQNKLTEYTVEIDENGKRLFGTVKDKITIHLPKYFGTKAVFMNWLREKYPNLVRIPDYNLTQNGIVPYMYSFNNGPLQLIISFEMVLQSNDDNYENYKIDPVKVCIHNGMTVAELKKSISTSSVESR